MSDSLDVFGKVALAVKSEFPNFDGAIDRNTTAMDVDGWDSLAHTTLILKLEGLFGIEIDPEASLDFVNIGELCDYIFKRL